MRQIPKVVCADGFYVSVQASSRHYCEPRSDAGPWTEFELGYPSEPDELITQYAESPDRPTDTVYGYVPVGVVEALIAKHGGADDHWKAFETPSVERVLCMDYSDALSTARYLGIENTLKDLAAIIADKAADRETRQRAAERAEWVAGILPLA